MKRFICVLFLCFSALSFASDHSKAETPSAPEESFSLSIDWVHPKPGMTRKGARGYFPMEIPEFTCLCPLTGQPDFAEFIINYVPDKLCVELKSIKLYMGSFRDVGAFHEDNTNNVLKDISTLIKPSSSDSALRTPATVSIETSFF